MTNSDRVQMLEALLERVTRNRSAAPHHAHATATPAAPRVSAAPPTATPPMPLVVPRQETPPLPSVAPAAWQPEPGSAVQPRPGTLPPESLASEEISEDDLLEVTTIPPDAVEVDLSDLPVLEPDTMEVSEITAVGVRVSAGTLDEALASAAELDNDALEGEREAPIQTPPPESGPQEALPQTGFEAARTPDIDQLEADLISPPSLGPTPEQLGETIELEAPRGPQLEIDVTVEEPPPSTEQAPPEELEVALPRPSLQSGLYDVTAPPPAEYPAPMLADAPPAIPADTGPDRTARPALGATDVARVTLGAPAAPKTFVELLDASLLV